MNLRRTLFAVAAALVVGGRGDSNAPNGTFVQSLTTQDFDTGVAGLMTAIACTGHYHVRGSTVTLTANVTPDCEGSVTGIISGARLTITDPSMGTAVFEKQQ